MRQNDHERWQEDLSAYLLDALDAERTAELERHLAGCEECRAELTWLRPAAQVLPESVEQVEPPIGLRTRIMAEVRTDAVAEGSHAAGLRERIAGWMRPTGLRFAAGLAALVVAVVGVGLAVRDGGSGGGASTVVAGKAPGVTATMVSEDGSSTLHLANLESLPPDEVLQAWVRRGGRVESANVLFRPNSDGTANAIIDDTGGASAVMVTAEPRGGSEQPTSEPLVSVPVS